METFEYKGHTFAMSFEYDHCMGPPWLEHDGHGIVSDWTTRAKRPCERVLVQDRQMYRYYDVQDSIAKAKHEGWDAPPYGGTPGERAARAVERDYDHLRRWCNDHWHWAFMTVTICDDFGDPVPDMSTSVGGVEYNVSGHTEEWTMELARELADEIIHQFEYA